MQRLIVGIFVALLFCPQPILAASLDKNNVSPQNVTGIRVKYNKTIQFVYDNKTYTVYAADCGEKIIQSIEAEHIILSPGDSVEIKHSNGHLLILYSLPCPRK